MDKYLEILQHWIDVRTKYKKLGLKAEWEENLRCAVDVADNLIADGVTVPSSCRNDVWEDTENGR